MPLPILQTKLFIPRSRPTLVPRGALMARLMDHPIRPLTLVSAPAGFGKTTLVSDWCRAYAALQVDVAPSTPAFCWLALDENDNELTCFLAYVIAALQTVDATLGTDLQLLLQAPQSLPLNTLLTHLINDLEVNARPIVLVLDDYHLITAQPVHNALTFLVENRPSTLHLVVTTRVDPPLPLARWRVRNQLTEVRASDLRFTLEEAATFLNSVMELSLSVSEIGKLETRTEGWIAGLQLAALSMEGRTNLTDFIDRFTGSHAYIIDYLVEEVLHQQPAEVQHFLLQSSILERLCGPLCDCLTGRSDGQVMLEQLQRTNLFLIPLDDERRWYRYHHLFADVLQNRLRYSTPDSLAALHLRASDWYETAGLLDEAMHHALAAPDLTRAALIVEAHSIPLLLRSEVVRINRWLQALPAPLIESRPHLALVAAWVYMAAFHLDGLTHILNDIPVLQRRDLDEEMQGQLLILRACLALFQGNFAQTIEYARQSLQFVPIELSSLRATALLLIGSGLAQSGDWSGAEPILRETITTGRTGGNLYNVMLAYHILSRLQSACGDAASAHTTLNEALQVATQEGQPLIPAVGVIYIGLGALWVEPERYPQAIATIQRGEELCKACFQLDVLLYGWQAQVRLHLAHSNQAQAHTVLDGAEAWLQQVILPQSMQQSVSQVLHTLRSSITEPIGAQPNRLLSTKTQALIEPLSEREIEILRLVNDGFSNSAIADRLIVTVGTVKKHLNNIYGKLGVSSRTQAIACGRELQLL